MRRIASTSLALALGVMAAFAFAQAPRTSAGAGTTSSAAPAPAPKATLVPTPSPTPNVEVPVAVGLVFNDQGVPVGVACPYPDPVELSVSKGQSARWVLASGDELEVKISGGGNGPFKDPIKNNGKDSKSQAPNHGTEHKGYKYTIRIKTANYGIFTLDPIIKITP